MTDASSTRTRLFFSILVLFFLILIAYANTLLSPFNFDDQALLQQVVVNDPVGFYQPWPIRYRHLLYLSFSLNHSLSGLSPFSYHLTNLLFHFLTSVTVLFIIFKTLAKNTKWESKTLVGLSLTTALLFALNPLHTEAITYISGRASGIGGFFFLLALLFFILGSERGRKPLAGLAFFYFLALLSFCLALLSKETTLTFPLVVILYDLFFMKNAAWHPFKNRLILIYLPFAILVGALIILSPEILNFARDWLGKINMDYALAQIKLLVHALKLCLFPVNLTFDYDLHTNFVPLSFASFLIVFILLLLVFAVLRGFRQITPVAIFSILWFLLIISPTNSFFPRVDLLSERNLYLPSLGPTFLMAFVFYQLFFIKSESSISKRGRVLLATVIFLMGSLLIIRNSDYRSNIHLWEDTYRKSPADLQVLHNLSHFYLKDKRYKQALVPLLRLSRSEAGDFYRAFAHSNLGSVYIQRGDIGRAEKEFHKAIELEPTLPLGYLNLGTYYASRGNFRQARTEFLRARERYIKFKWGYPMPSELDLNLARVNLQLKSFPDAEKHIFQFLQRIPGSSEGLLLLGKIYQEEGKIELSKKTFQSIQGEELVSSKAQNNLGILYIKTNQYEKARDAFNSAIKFYPQIPDAHYNLGKMILDSKGDRILARKHLELALSYNNSPSLEQEINRLLALLQ